MKFKPGDEVTAIFRHNTGRSVLLLEVKKVGRKYLHGLTLYKTPIGTISNGHEVKINIEESTIYKGLRHDLRDAEFQYRNDYRSWQQQRQEKISDFNYELRNFVNERTEEWEQENPMPQPPEFPAPEAEA